MNDALLTVAWNQRLSFAWLVAFLLKQVVLVSEYVIDLTNLVFLEMLPCQSPRTVKPLDHLRLHSLEMSLLVFLN